jgi:hypothetical protein
VTVGYLFGRAVQFWTPRLKAGTVCGAENYGIVSYSPGHAPSYLASASPYAGAVFIQNPPSGLF